MDSGGKPKVEIALRADAYLRKRIGGIIRETQLGVVILSIK
ncbi:MAG: hypothetical protein QOJ64_1693 [Acidobacteriota bacterium]|jgi:hypothetical protein|nr:hypothetical protein [Acidobacteriota bacterium]